MNSIALNPSPPRPNWSNKGIEVGLDGVRFLPTQYTIVFHRYWREAFQWTPATRSFTQGVSFDEEENGERKPTCCVRCRKPLTESIAHRVLLQGVWLVTGRVGIICPHCDSVRRWQPAMKPQKH